MNPWKPKDTFKIKFIGFSSNLTIRVVKKLKQLMKKEHVPIFIRKKKGKIVYMGFMKRKNGRKAIKENKKINCISIINTTHENNTCCFWDREKTGWVFVITQDDTIMDQITLVWKYICLLCET